MHKFHTVLFVSAHSGAIRIPTYILCLRLVFYIRWQSQSISITTVLVISCTVK